MAPACGVGRSWEAAGPFPGQVALGLTKSSGHGVSAALASGPSCAASKPAARSNHPHYFHSVFTARLTSFSLQ